MDLEVKKEGKDEELSVEKSCAEKGRLGDKEIWSLIQTETWAQINGC